MKNFILFLALAFTFSAFAQRNCGADDYLQLQLAQDPFLQERMMQIEERTELFENSPQKKVATLVTIPVVVHVVYNKRSNAQNISTAQINSQIAILNQDFRRLNNDATNNWAQAADAEVEFCLASVDPNGNPTSGIIRKQTNKNSFSYINDGVKFASSVGSNAWPASEYLNIWVCDLSNGLLGYAQFPGGNASTDGVVVDYAYFGNQGTATAPFHLGRTCTHEVGHWLNLRHIWGDGGCGVDDFVGDTPESDGPNYGCAYGHISCTTVDMIENYMDYSDDACMNLFTGGQKTRMQSLFAPGGFRASLLNSPGCGGGGSTGPTCTDGVQNGDETGIDCGGTVCPPCNTTACLDPTGLSSNSRKGGREANLSWDAVTGAINYTVELKASSSSSWANTTTAGTAVTATGLTRNVSYDWRVRANCASGSSNFSSQTFIARNSSNREEYSEFSIYPNPASDYMTLSYPVEREMMLSVRIFNVAGEMVCSKSYQAVSGNNEYELDIEDLRNGVYLIQISSEAGSHNRRITIMR